MGIEKRLKPINQSIYLSLSISRSGQVVLFSGPARRRPGNNPGRPLLVNIIPENPFSPTEEIAANPPFRHHCVGGKGCTIQQRRTLILISRPSVRARCVESQDTEPNSTRGVRPSVAGPSSQTGLCATTNPTSAFTLDLSTHRRR